MKFEIKLIVGGTEIDEGQSLTWYKKLQCDFCKKRFSKLFYMPTPHDVFACTKCLKDIREKIDAFRILVQTGENTK